MTVRQVTKILGEIPIRRVDGGDDWIMRANAELSEEKFRRFMNGDDIAIVYNGLNLDQRAIADRAFELSDAEINDLVDEVFRIREDQSEGEKVSRNDSFLQIFGFLFSLTLLSLGGVAVALVFVSTLQSQEVPTGYVLSTIQMLIRYIAQQDIGTP